MDRFLELAAFYSAAFQSPLIAFVLTSLIIEMTRGPNMAHLAVLGASRGRLAGFSAVLGVALGLALLGIAVGLGAGSLILNNPVRLRNPALGRRDLPFHLDAVGVEAFIVNQPFSQHHRLRRTIRLDINLALQALEAVAVRIQDILIKRDAIVVHSRLLAVCVAHCRVQMGT
ncbi:hypothetical protein IVA95_23180 [Bradyrhizobium sp. 157]|uniref:hypothetical protein n=1 Tax=Bradyrhizobium sp. 157 TaxID=2782631 RepID=UPI001FF93570|nr:hypothetical protein [Bradyrhizobium sp. 157]MCK1640414.1 hypothetical protein [Bradyrhizobium sp. 157]